MTPKKTRTSQPEPEIWAGTADEWRQRSVHRAELPSGMRIEFRRPTLGHLIRTGALPDHLRQAAVDEYATPGAAVHAIAALYKNLPEGSTPEQEAEADAAALAIAEQIAALTREICAAALIAPSLTADELADPDFPIEDLEMLEGFVTGHQHMDAAGRWVGVMPLDEAKTFCDEHGCAPGCEAGARAQRRLSTLDGRAL